MPLNDTVVTDFRRRLREAVENNRDDWAASRRLVAPAAVSDTLRRLEVAVAGSGLEPALRDELLLLLSHGSSAGLKALPQDALRGLTGLNPTKAVRNLCLLLGVGTADQAWTVPTMAQESVEAVVRNRDNPFDVLLEADVASVVDLGAGDLTFEEKVVEQYLPPLEQSGRDLILHSLDRLDPKEKFGGLVQADRDRLNRLQRHPSSHLRFHFDGNQDMFDLDRRSPGPSRYTVAVCHSPASPTFAYEPTRLGMPAIQSRLRKTKGEFRLVRDKGRDVLKVLNKGEWFTFPPWKFDVYGPLALLDLLSRKGKVCVLGAVDMEVFWEILSQLLPDKTARPQGVFFTERNVGQYFGHPYERLSRLAVGEKTVIPEVRRDIPRVLGAEGKRGETHGFRFIEIRRGAVFPGVPGGRTALIFDQMTKEAAPWFLTLVPGS